MRTARGLRRPPERGFAGKRGRHLFGPGPGRGEQRRQPSCQPVRPADDPLGQQPVRIDFSLRWNPFRVPIYIAANNTCQPAPSRVFAALTDALRDLRAAHEQLHTASLHISRATDCQLLNVPNRRRFPPLVPGNLKIKQVGKHDLPR